MKIAFGVEYDGSNFVGWQRQSNGRTVQACIEAALSRVANQPVGVYCAGRTDSGVHASGQVIHLDVSVSRSERSWVLGANSNLPSDVSIQWARTVDESFHARFSALGRTYRYVISNRVARPGLWSKKVTFIYQPLDAERMLIGANNLLGEHDFSSFRAAGCQAPHARRVVRSIDIVRRGELIIITIEANAFLQHMVRNIVGTLQAVGDGRRAPSWVAEVLDARDRKCAGRTAPADGLYLAAVTYPPKYALPQLSSIAHPWA